MDDPDGEKNELLSLLTTNVTHFFREQHHFETLADQVLPNLIRKAKSGERVRIWSSACSTGEELYSIAILVAKLFPDADKYDFRLLGTDIDPEVLKKAQAANYTAEALQNIPEKFRNEHSLAWAQSGALPKMFTNICRFGVLNLTAPLPFRGNFDAIFCRNVAIYFDKTTQKRLWASLHSVLKEDGFLFIGHSERISGEHTCQFESCGITTYRLVSKEKISGHRASYLGENV